MSPLLEFFDSELVILHRHREIPSRLGECFSPQPERPGRTHHKSNGPLDRIEVIQRPLRRRRLVHRGFLEIQHGALNDAARKERCLADPRPVGQRPRPDPSMNIVEIFENRRRIEQSFTRGGLQRGNQTQRVHCEQLGRIREDVAGLFDHRKSESPQGEADASGERGSRGQK